VIRIELFRAMAASYGADLERWPTALRDEARRLAQTSEAARLALDEARTIDAALDAASVQPDEPAAALARLRAGVAARIAAAPARPVGLARFAAWLMQFGRVDPVWIGMATGSGCVVAAGLMIGAALAPTPEAEDLLALLQPVPMHILAR
jgi:hypothetical protein